MSDERTIAPYAYYDSNPPTAKTSIPDWMPQPRPKAPTIAVPLGNGSPESSPGETFGSDAGVAKKK